MALKCKNLKSSKTSQSVSILGIPVNYSLLNAVLNNIIVYYNNFIGHCGVFCGLKWRIQRAKIYFSPLL